MRTLTVHTADELATRWKRWAAEAEASIRGDEFDGYYDGLAQGYRVAAAELQALAAVSMELEAAHHGDPEVGNDNPANALMEWSQGRRP